MEFRPDTTTSERQLVLALATGGRDISLSKLALWRKSGLLPPLASSGVGGGRTYYWREPDIQAHAETAYDALRQYGRSDMAIITLWLNGFAVPLTHLRRAWLYRARQRKTPQLRRAPAPTSLPQRQGWAELALQVIVRIADMLDLDGGKPELALQVLGRAATRLGHSAQGAAAQHLGPLTMLAIWTLEPGELVRQAGDDELRDAQRYLRIAMAFLADGCSETELAAVTKSLRAPLFLFLLASLHCDEKALIEAIAARITAAERRADHPPLRAVGMYA